MPITRNQLDVLARHLAAENAHDVAAVLACYVEDPVLALNSSVFEGRERIRQLYDGLGFGGGAGDFDELQLEEKARVVGEEAVAIQQTLSGAHNRDRHGVPATGKRNTAPVCTWNRFSPDGRIARQDRYLDLAQIRRQLTTEPVR
jgi:steroid delta-isomerase-like uncharacterized protein